MPKLGGAHQREIAAEKERDDHDTTTSKHLLDQFEQLSRMHLVELEQELNDGSSALQSLSNCRGFDSPSGGPVEDLLPVHAVCHSRSMPDLNMSTIS